MSLFETERLQYRLFADEDADFLFDHWSNEEIVKYMQDWRLESVDEALEDVALFKEWEEKYHYSCYLVVEKETGERLGTVGGWPVVSDKFGNKRRNFEIGEILADDEVIEIETGYDFIQSSWGKGYATESFKEMIKRLLERCVGKKLVAYVHTENTGSMRVLEKCGMKKKSGLFDEGNEFTPARYRYEL